MACDWRLFGYDAVYVALADLTDGVWLTADARAAGKVSRSGLVRVLGR
jgi:predicted nucleic acid-binding protein